MINVLSIYIQIKLILFDSFKLFKQEIFLIKKLNLKFIKLNFVLKN